METSTVEITSVNISVFKEGNIVHMTKIFQGGVDLLNLGG